MSLRNTPPKDFSFDFERWPYPLYPDNSARLQELARKYSQLARLLSLGKTQEGRDLWVMEITNRETGGGARS